MCGVHPQAEGSSHVSNVLFRRWEKIVLVQVGIYLFPGKSCLILFLA